MLNINLVSCYKELPDYAVSDVEQEFVSLDLEVTDTTQTIVKLIDKCTLLSSLRCKDRFGVTIYNSQLSTGCKAALLAACTDKFVSLQECGPNAIDVIINFGCGNIVLERGYTGISELDNHRNRRIYVDGVPVNSIYELNCLLDRR